MTHTPQNRCNTAPAPAGAFVPGDAGAALRALCRRPLLWAGLALCLLAGYAPALFGGVAVGIDDLAIDIYQQGGEFLRQGRITQWLVQAATGLLTCRPFWPEFLAGVCLALAGVCLAALLYAAAGLQPGTAGALLLAGGLLLFPLHAEILAYSNQLTVLFGILLTVLALAACRAHILGGWRQGLPGAAGSTVLLAFALGCYESMAQVWLTLVFAYLFTAAQSLPPHSRKAGWCVPAVLRGVWPFAAGLLLRSGLAAALRAVLGVTGANGTAATTVYWFRRESAAQALRIFVSQWLDTYAARALAMPGLGLLSLGCAVLVVYTAVRRHGNGSGLLAAGLLGSVFAMGILQGTGSQMARASQCFAVFVPFVAWLCLRGALAGTGARRAAALAAAAVLLAVEGVSLGRGFAADRARWHYEQQLLQTAAAQLDALDPGGTVPVVFGGSVTLPDEVSGKLPASSPVYKVQYLLSVTLGAPLGDDYRYEDVNESVINWALDAFGGQEQMYRLMDRVGRPCARPTPEQQAAGSALAGDAAPGTVTQQAGYLLVRF